MLIVIRKIFFNENENYVEFLNHIKNNDEQVNDTVDNTDNDSVESNINNNSLNGLIHMLQNQVIDKNPRNKYT